MSFTSNNGQLEPDGTTLQGARFQDVGWRRSFVGGRDRQLTGSGQRP